MKIKLTGKAAKLLSKPYLDPSYFMIRCPECGAVVDKRRHKHENKR